MQQSQGATRKAYHSCQASEVLAAFDVDPRQGLDDREVGARLRLYGPNQLTNHAGTHPGFLLLGQFTNLMIIVLLVAAVVAGLIGELLDAVAILVIVALNGIIGFMQEYRAERALRALQQLSAPRVEVLRNGRIIQVDEAELVPGDIVQLQGGHVVPADLCLIESSNLTVDEAPLTGE